jgi:hypothetical protein
MTDWVSSNSGRLGEELSASSRAAATPYRAIE